MTNNPDVLIDPVTNRDADRYCSLKADYLQKQGQSVHQSARIMPVGGMYHHPGGFIDLPSGRRLRKRCSGGYFARISDFPTGIGHDDRYDIFGFYLIIPIWQPSRLPEYFRHRQLPDFLCGKHSADVTSEIIQSGADSGHYPLRSGGVRTFRMLVLLLPIILLFFKFGIDAVWSPCFLFGNHQGVECCNFIFFQGDICRLT